VSYDISPLEIAKIGQWRIQGGALAFNRMVSICVMKVKENRN
jgi:hypothetical protein